MIIVTDSEGGCAVGKTLNEAYIIYKDEVCSDMGVLDLTWYEAEEIKVAFNVIKVVTETTQIKRAKK